MILALTATIFGAAYLLDARRAEIRSRDLYHAAIARRLASLGLV